MSSNTTADNMYAVKSVSHNINAGQFKTDVALTFIAQNSIKDIRSKIQTVAESLNKTADVKVDKSPETKKLCEPSQERADKNKSDRHWFPHRTGR
jgi:formylmethanofuran dehydrogenase subunit A